MSRGTSWPAYILEGNLCVLAAQCAQEMSFIIATAVCMKTECIVCECRLLWSTVDNGAEKRVVQKVWWINHQSKHASQFKSITRLLDMRFCTPLNFTGSRSGDWIHTFMLPKMTTSTECSGESSTQWKKQVHIQNIHNRSLDNLS